MTFDTLFNKNILQGLLFPVTFLFFLYSTSFAKTEWNSENSGTAKTLHGVGWTGEVFVAVGGDHNDTGIILYSFNGKKWNIVDSTIPCIITDVVCPGDNYDILAIGSTSNKFSIISKSSDGITWTTKKLSYRIGCCEIMWDGNKYISSVGSNGGVYISTNGIDWSFYTTPGGCGISWYDIAWSGNLYICGSQCELMYSTDGINWEIKDFHLGSPSTITWTGEKFFLAEGGTSVRYSTDGTSWSNSIKLPKSYRSSTRSKTAYAFDSNGHDKRSGLDGRIRWTGKELIHVFDRICTSPDGIDWTLECDSIKNSEGKWDVLRDIAWNDNIFVAVGTSGTILTSPRKNTIISEKHITKKNINNTIAIHTIGSKLYASLPSVLENKSVSIAIYNISGKKVFLQNSHISGNTIEYDLTNIPSGYYTFVAKSKEFEMKKKFLLTR